MLAEAVFKHSTHLEDCFYDGPEKVQEAIATLDDIIKQFSGSNENIKIQSKVDGAPSIIFIKLGKDFGISTKAIFNKTPKCAWSLDDIQDIFGEKSQDLVNKLKVAYTYLKNITPNNSVYQGDLLYTKDTLEKMTIEGKECITWHPNTILYSVELDTKLGQKIANSELGIAVHTRYTWDGKELTSLELSDFDVHSDEFKKSPKVFLIDTYQTDFSAIVNLDDDEKESYIQNKKYVEDSLKNINFDLLKKYEDILDGYHNYIIKQDIQDDYIGNLKTYIEDKKLTKKYPNIIEDIDKYSKDLNEFYQVYLALRSMKNIIIHHLNELQNSNCFVQKRTRDGIVLVPTDPEGFVLTSGPMSGYKLVDRYTFSKLNFSNNILKGFKH